MFWKPKLIFDRIITHRHPNWPNNFLKSPLPGTLLILPGTVGTVGGMLCLSKDGVWVSVDKDQVYNEKKITWPGHGKFPKYIQIVGDSIIVE